MIFNSFFFSDKIDKIDRTLIQLTKREDPNLTESEINRGTFKRYQGNSEYIKEKYTPLIRKT